MATRFSTPCLVSCFLAAKEMRHLLLEATQVLYLVRLEKSIRYGVHKLYTRSIPSQQSSPLTKPGFDGQLLLPHLNPGRQSEW